MSKITPISDFWFNKSNRQFWFNSTPETDKIVLENTQIYFDDQSLVSKLSYVDQIIFHDQLIRHYVRFHNLNKSIVNDHNIIAINITQNILDSSDEMDNLTSIEQCFVLMPLRHSSYESDREKVIKIIEQYLDLDPKNPDYIRFYQASLERVRNPQLIIGYDHFPQELVCKSSVFMIKDHEVYSAWYNSINLEMIPPEFIEGFRQTIPIDKPITISISGGSDSMLCLFIAHKLGYKTIALMIDYGNREEHEKEVDFVAWFCKELDVPFYVRRIKELKRTRDGNREFYEKVTKNIRFGSYKFLNNPVILGHNLDDCFENCITNIMSHRSKDNLFGMRPKSEQEGIIIYRPVLKISKKRIVEMCNLFKIPYLLDSTPKWSRRGQIRDIIVPALNTFDTNLIPRIMEFCQESSESIIDYQRLLDTFPITESVNKKKQKIFSFTLTVPFNTNPRFWQGMLNKITDTAQLKRVRINTISSMIKSIENDYQSQRELKISLTTELIAYLATSRTEIKFIVQS
jgi:tRNA(Ile)-lysidine synthetase-like protein